MANSDIKSLRIVGKKSDYIEEKVKMLSIHAYYIWEEATFFSSLEEAVEDCSLVIGTTRRRGKKRGKLYLPFEMATFVDRIESKVAIVFGNERTGLQDNEMALCTMGLTIPSSPNFASLNLSHAVQIVCYTLYEKSLRDKGKLAKINAISLLRLKEAVNVVIESFEEIGFFTKAGKKEQEQFWRNIFSRASLTESEVQYIEYIFKKAACLAIHNK